MTALGIVLGIPFIVLAPGMAWSYIFFGKKEIDWIERIGLSVGLSLVLVPITVFWLNWIFNMKLSAVSVIITVIILVLIPLVASLVKKTDRYKAITVRIKSTFSFNRKSGDSID